MVGARLLCICRARQRFRNSSPVAEGASHTYGSVQKFPIGPVIDTALDGLVVTLFVIPVAILLGMSTRRWIRAAWDAGGRWADDERDGEAEEYSIETLRSGSTTSLRYTSGRGGAIVRTAWDDPSDGGTWEAAMVVS